MNTKAITLTIERTPRTLKFADGTTQQVEELGVRLPMARKPADLSELSVYTGRPQKIYITETVLLSAQEFDVFSNRLLVSRDWLKGKGGATADAVFCVEVTAPDRPFLYVNPEGSDYARYVGQLG
jgi:hypothetical protein